MKNDNTQAQFDKKIDNLQDQIDMIQLGDSVFKGYVHRQFGVVIKKMATKDDWSRLSTIVLKIAEKVGVSM